MLWLTVYCVKRPIHRSTEVMYFEIALFATFSILFTGKNAYKGTRAT